MKRNDSLSIRQSEFLLAAVILARSTSFVFSKMSMASMGPLTILGVRFLTAFLILLVLFRKRLSDCTRKDFRDGFILGITYSLVMIFEMFGLRTADTSFASLVENSAFMLVPVIEFVLIKKLPEKKIVAGMLLAFFGVVVLNLGPGASFNTGVICVFTAMAFYAVAIYQTSVFSKEADPLLVGIIQIGTMGVVTFAGALLFEDFRLPENTREWTMILLLAVVCSVFGFTLQPVAQRSLDADRAGMFSALNPLGAILWGALVLGEKITLLKAVGAVLILTGLLLPSMKLSGIRRRVNGVQGE